MMNWEKRIQNKYFWVSIFALIGLIVNDATNITPEQYNVYVNAIMSVLVAVGIIVDPSTDGFKDSNK